MKQQAAEAILLQWRDIPSQVIVKRGRRRGRARLSARFQKAIDRAAMRAKKHDANAYLDQWERKPLKFESEDAAADLQEAADRLAAGIETAYPEDRLLALIRNHGLADD